MLMIPIDTSLTVPIYEQVYEFIKNEIRQGKLYVNEKLPSSRKLSEYLQISRSTVDLAYHQLLAEGYIQSRPKSGYYVQSVGALVHLKQNEQGECHNVFESETQVTYDYSPFLVDISGFPFATWRKLNNKCLNDLNQDLFLLGHSQGDEPLRKAIASYLYNSRGANVSAKHIIIGAGTDYLLLLLMQILNTNHLIAMENPCYPRAFHILKGLGQQIVAVDTDEEGLDVEQLKQTNSDLVYVTPSHQYPLGMVMPVKRRAELLRWADMEENRYIIEDDHDSEFRYKGKPIPCLQGMDQNQKVIYFGTFSRAIAPAIRIGYMVLPEVLYEKYRQKLSYYSSTVSRIDQSILTEFISGGFFERHINKMRTRYKSKHDTMLHVLKIFKDHIQITGENAGLHMVVQFYVKCSEEELIAYAYQEKIKLYGLNRHYIIPKNKEHPTILLGFSNVSEQQIFEGIKKLYEICINRNLFL